jgi:hypothetical protein
MFLIFLTAIVWYRWRQGLVNYTYRDNFIQHMVAILKTKYPKVKKRSLITTAVVEKNSLMGPSESAPQDLSNEWSCQYVSTQFLCPAISPNYWFKSSVKWCFVAIWRTHWWTNRLLPLTWIQGSFNYETFSDWRNWLVHLLATKPCFTDNLNRCL